VKKNHQNTTFKFKLLTYRSSKMPKFARPNSYTGKQSNQNWTGDVRAANLTETLAGDSTQIYISPSTLAAAAGTVVPTATTLVAGKTFLATDAEAVTGTASTNKAIIPSSLTARLAAPGTIGGTTPGAGHFAALDSTGITSIGTGAGVATKVGNATGTVGFFGATGATIVTQGAITNNVTVGGTTGTIADFTDLTVYANDAAAIRNDIYQLSLALANVVGALRSYGMLA
jgi:hypothetical protein